MLRNTTFHILDGLGLRASLFFLAAALLAPHATAGHGEPGSLVILPQFDSRAGRVSVVNLTNTSATESAAVEFVYIGWPESAPGTCNEFNRTHAFTPGDTLSVVSSMHNPSMAEGFVYAFAKSDQTLEAISFNHLIGSVTVIDGILGSAYAIEGFTYASPLAQGTATDLDADGLHDLDGVEYAAAPDEILVPRFLGESENYANELFLLNLTLTRQAEAVVLILAYNDNEEVFSAQYEFNCWNRTPLTAVSQLFTNDFQKVTNHDPAEPIGSTTREIGWFRIDGLTATTSTTVVADPAILGFLVERVTTAGTTAALPFESGLQTNGRLFEVNETPAD